MMVLDLHICYLDCMGMVLLAFFVGGILYSTSRFALASIPAADSGVDGPSLAALCSLAPY